MSFVILYYFPASIGWRFVSGDKYASREFVRLVEHSAAKLLEFMQAEVINQKLVGLGVQSPMSISFDGMSIGDSLYARHETFQVTIATALSLSPGVPLLATYFLHCPSVGLSHDGDSQAACVLRTLEGHAGQFNKRSLRRRVLTMIAGDGAVARGGQSMRHVSTEACNKLAKFLALRMCPDCFFLNRKHRLTVCYTILFLSQ